MAEYKTGGVYAEWHRDVRNPYVRMLNKMIDELNCIPRWGNSIHQSDIITLIKLCEAFGIEYDISKLKDPMQFEIVKGKIQKEIKNIIEKELKPEDPFYKFLQEQQLSEEELREFMKQMEREKHEEVATEE